MMKGQNLRHTEIVMLNRHKETKNKAYRRTVTKGLKGEVRKRGAKKKKMRKNPIYLGPKTMKPMYLLLIA